MAASRASAANPMNVALKPKCCSTRPETTGPTTPPTAWAVAKTPSNELN